MNDLRGILAPRWVAALCGSLAVTVGARDSGGHDDRSRRPERCFAPATDDTGDRVQVGSVAKTLVATGMLALVTQGRLDLDAPVARYLPEVPIENRWESDAPLRDGLTHPGGTLRLRHRPGERFSYSNTGYLLLGIKVSLPQGTTSWKTAISQRAIAAPNSLASSAG